MIETKAVKNIEQQTMEVNVDEMLTILSKKNSFNVLEKNLDIFFFEKDPYNLQIRLVEHFGNKIGTSIFVYLFDDIKIDNITNKSLREYLAKLNLLKSLYGSLIKDSMKKISNPFFLSNIMYSNNEYKNLALLTLTRNDNQNLSIELDTNTLLVMATQTIDVLKNMYSNLDATFDFERFKSLLETVNEFVKLITDKAEENSSESD
ncbi:hypothetical protein [Paenibacillus sp. GXUN7292]|uniref:hypothetical protein n=1 Tax=Paenibacillus sp. GXUN7292 TaxID=3422499 RepID=UPI003D7E827B